MQWGFTIFDHLFGVPLDTLEVELMLATSLETPDPLTVIFTIGEAFFHDKAPANGRQVLATDIKARLRSRLGRTGHLAG